MPPRGRKRVWVHESQRTPEYESDLEVDLMEEDDDDDNAGQKNNKGKRSNVNPNNGPAAAVAPPPVPAAPLEPPPPFDAKTFKHQPIPAAHHPRMKAVSDSWDIPKGPLDLLAQLVRESAVLLTDAGETVDPTTLRMLDKTMKDVVDMQNEVNARKNAAMGLRQKLTHGEILVDPVATWDNAVQKDVNTYQKKTARQKYANDNTYVQYREELWSVKNEGAMPPLKSVIPKEDGDDSDDDDEVEVGGMVVTLRDPLTKAWLDDPVTSKKCHHSYSRASMNDYLRTARDVKKCPAAGCGENVSRADLEDDENLARQVRNAKRREEERDRAKKGKRTMVVDDSDDEIVE